MNGYIDWQRFWYDRELLPQGPLLRNGFLPDPSSIFGSATGLFRLDDIWSEPALALLGEPGSGKSTDIRAVIERKNERPGESPSAVYCNLRDFSSFQLMVSWLEHHPYLQGWWVDDSEACLIWDSLDEAPFPNAPELISAWLLDNASSRLKVRIACRALAWSVSLEHTLELLAKKLESKVRVLVLAPLRQEDVILASPTIDEEFLGTVIRLDIGHLAASPSFLFLLIEICAKGGTLPVSRYDALQLSVKTACRWERDDPYRPFQPKLDSEQVRFIASRIAAVSVLCQLPRIRLWGAESETRKGELSASMLVGSSALGDWSDGLLVTRDDLQEVLNVPLFSSPSPTLRQFTHRTSAEFLTAEYLSRLDLDIRQIRPLLFEPESRRVVPQLQGMVALFATFNRDILMLVAEREPHILLQGDLLKCRPEDRKHVLLRLTHLVGTKELVFDEVLGTFHGKDFAGLKFDTIEGVLGPILRDRSMSRDARWLAIEIAEGCAPRECEKELVRIALDAQEDLLLRTQAAWAVAREGSDDGKRALIPLIQLDADADPSDELRGCALNAVWPRLAKIEELLPYIARPRKASYYGSYRSFLDGPFTDELPGEFLEPALSWASGRLTADPFDFADDEVVKRLIFRGLQRLGEPTILDLVADIVLAAMRKDKTGLSFDIEDESQRQSLVRGLVERITEGEASLLMLGHRNIIHSSDFAWLFQEGVSPANDRRKSFLEVAYQVYWDDEEPNRMVLTEHKEDLLVQAVFGKALEFADPESEASLERETMRARYVQRQKELEVRQAEERENQERRVEAIERFLTEAPTDPNTYVFMDLAITSDSASAMSGRLIVRLTSTSWWQQTGKENKEQLVFAASAYLQSSRDNPDDWFGTNSYPYRSMAAFRALILLGDHSVPVSPEVYEAWMPVIVSFPTYGEGDDAQAHASLIGRAYAAAPHEFLSWMDRYVTSHEGRTGYLFDVGRFEGAMDETVASRLLILAQNVSPASMGEILGTLL